MDNSLISPSIDLTSFASGETVTLSFYEYYDIESEFDYAYVGISTDGGSSWNTVAGPYSGNATSWAQRTIDISSYAGDTIQIGFRFTSDDSVVYEGWYIDDVAVSVN